MTRGAALPRRTARALDRATEQRVEAAACHRSKNIDNKDDQRERRAERRAEERDTDDVCVPGDEDQDSSDEEDDNDEVDPPHRSPAAFRTLTIAVQWTMEFLCPAHS